MEIPGHFSAEIYSKCKVSANCYEENQGLANGSGCRAMINRSAIMVVLAPLLFGNGASQSSIIGKWTNSHRTVVVDAFSCNRNELCGRVVNANADAIIDASEAGTKNLVGTNVLRDYHSDRNGVWHGTVFVPDMGRSFTSHMQLLGPDRLKVTGCLLGNFICKSDVWIRIPG